jgi:hypothetical protein
VDLFDNIGTRLNHPCHFGEPFADHYGTVPYVWRKNLDIRRWSVQYFVDGLVAAVSETESRHCMRSRLPAEIDIISNILFYF